MSLWRPNALFIAVFITLLTFGLMGLVLAALGGAIPFVDDGCGGRTPNTNVSSSALNIISMAVGGLIGMGTALLDAKGDKSGKKPGNSTKGEKDF